MSTAASRAGSYGVIDTMDEKAKKLGETLTDRHAKRLLIGLPLVLLCILIGTIIQVSAHGHFHSAFIIGVVLGIITGGAIYAMADVVADTIYGAFLE